MMAIAATEERGVEVSRHYALESDAGCSTDVKQILLEAAGEI